MPNRTPQLSARELRELAERLPAPPKWKPYKPVPLPHGVQERIDAYRAIPGLTESGYK